MNDATFLIVDLVIVALLLCTGYLLAKIERNTRPPKK